MTDDFDVSLRRRLETVASAVPVAPPGDVAAVVRQPVRARSTSRLALTGLLPVLAVVVIGLVLASVMKIDRGPGDASAGSSNAANGPNETTTRSGDFELTIRSIKARYTVDEPITIQASLTYGGTEPIQIAHGMRANEGPIGFGIEEPVIGDLRMTPTTDDACVRSTLVLGQPLVVAFSKSGGWSSDDPRSEDYLAYMQDPVLRLAAGTWHVYAVASFSLGECTPDPIEMRVDLAIAVEGTAATAAPSATPAFSPGPTFNPFDEGVVDGFEVGDLKLVIRSEGSVYRARDLIDLSASYEYVGPEPTVELAHFEPEIAFSIEQLDATDPTVGWAKVYDSSCSQVTLEEGVPREVDMRAHNLMSMRADALPAGFLALLDEGTLRLPAGRWRINAGLSTSIGRCEDQRREDRALHAAIEIDVVENPAPIELSTVPDGDGACMQALGFGTVAINERTGLGWVDGSSGSSDVIWPAGFSARYEDGLAVLVDAAGRIVAREGDPIRMGGGQVDARGWVGCELDPFDASPVNIQTATGPQQCRTGTGSHLGTLARAAETGLGIAGSSGAVTPVRWPFGYTAREAPDRLVLFDAAGSLVAWEGASIGFSEALVDDATLSACADVGRVLTAN